jgi:hypothetical protein
MLIRDNGIFADSYLPVADLDPRMANAALDALREAGIAAYAKASPGIPGPYLDVHLPVRPSDRLFVDASAASTARSLLAGLLPGEHGWVPVDESGGSTQVPAELVGTTGSRGTSEPDLDQAWEQIVAGFDAATADPVPRWPAEEDVVPAGDPADEQDGGRRDGRVIRRVDVGDGSGSAHQEGGEGAGAESDAAEPTEADEGHFVPPEPPPLPDLEPITRISWIGLLGGPALLLLATILGWQLTEAIVFVAVGAFVAGFATLVVRMKDRPPTDLGGDDGAVL